MSGRLKKILLLVLAAALLAGSGFVQKSMNHDRDTLGLTHVEGLTNAPPVLAFTTVALGGFRGLISNMLWMRASQLQEEDKFFEMAQLSDWITKLEPHFSQVWAHEAWNMAYNISVKFKDYPDRWRWVQRGFELLRDEGLRYNPNDVMIHQQLAWIFQHKMGANLDDASMYYKDEWRKEMEAVLGKKPNFDELIHPQTQDQTNRARLLRETYKMDPAFMKTVDEQYGPLEWRLPEAHAIYWASQGLYRATNNPIRVKQDDLITLRRVIYQDMLLSFQRGRLVENQFEDPFGLGPNLEIIPRINEAYLQSYAEEADPNQKNGILKAHRNFLRQAIYTLYEYNRIADAEKWFKYLGEKYPDQGIIEGREDSYPRNVTLYEYVMSCFNVDANETNRDRVRGNIEGMLVRYYQSLVIGEDDRAAGYYLIAQQIWENYQKKIPAERMSATGLPPFSDIDQDIRSRCLNPDNGWPPEARAMLRMKLNISTTTNAPADPGERK
jgi:hypothetical protein